MIVHYLNNWSNSIKWVSILHNCSHKIYGVWHRLSSILMWGKIYLRHVKISQQTILYNLTEGSIFSSKLANIYKYRSFFVLVLNVTPVWVYGEKNNYPYIRSSMTKNKITEIDLTSIKYWVHWTIWKWINNCTRMNVVARVEWTCDHLHFSENEIWKWKHRAGSLSYNSYNFNLLEKSNLN